MKENIGSIDRIIRVWLASVFGVLYILHIVNHGMELWLLGFAVILLLTGTIKRCPLYYFMRIGTNKENRNQG